MARSRFNDPIEPMTLGNMRAKGVRSLDVSCWLCDHRAILSADARGTPAALLGHVDAPDEETAIRKAIDAFAIEPAFQKRLLARAARLQNTDEHVIGEKRYIKGVVVS
jgi:hypothetical protein